MCLMYCSCFVSLMLLFFRSCRLVNDVVMLLLLLLFFMCLMCCGRYCSVIVVVATTATTTTVVVVLDVLVLFLLCFYVLAVAAVIVLDMWFLGDVHMNEVWIIRFFGGKVGILGGNLGYLIMPKSGS